jgi:hypothetical protein
MMNFVLTFLAGLSLLGALGFLALFAFRARLPFQEGKVTETQLSPMPADPRLLRFLVRYSLPASARPSGYPRNVLSFLFLSRSPDRVTRSRRYERLKEFYRAGKVLKLHYFPHLEWLFGYIPEGPGFPPGTVAGVITVILSGIMLAIFRSGA